MFKALNAAMGGVVLPNPHGYENGVLHVEFKESGKAFFGRDGMDVAEASEDGIKENDERLKVMLIHGVSVEMLSQLWVSSVDGVLPVSRRR